MERMISKKALVKILFLMLAICMLPLPAVSVSAEEYLEVYVLMEGWGMEEGRPLPYTLSDFGTSLEAEGVSVSKICWYFHGEDGAIETAKKGDYFHKGNWHCELWLEDSADVLPYEDLELIFGGQLHEEWTYMGGTSVKRYACEPFIVHEARGSCGEHAWYAFDWDTKILTIGGTGPMEDYRGDEQDKPWARLLPLIESCQVLDGITRVGNSAFEGCDILKEALLADSVTDIGDFAFYACYAMEELPVMEGAVNIGHGSFGYCESLKEVRIPESVEGIARAAFVGCSALEDVVVPDSVQMILEEAFSKCTSLKTAELPAGLLTSHQYSESKAFSGSKKAVVTYRLSKNEVAKIPDQVWQGKKVEPKVKVLIGDTVLKKGTDYTVSYKNNTKTGTASAIITGQGTYTGKVVRKFKIKTKRISIAGAQTGEIENCVYTGKRQKPEVVVILDDVELEKGTDYSLTYKNNKNVGKATVTVKGKGAYKGTLSASFSIVPKGTRLKALTGGKKRFTAKWKKQPKQTTGYQLQYSTDDTFAEGVKRKWVRSADTAKLTVKKLQKGTVYFVRIRTYTKKGRRYYYSAWSKAKQVRTR